MSLLLALTGGPAPPAPVGGAVLRRLREIRARDVEDAAKADARYYAELAESIRPEIERVVEVAARIAERDSLSAKKARAELRRELAELDVATAERRHAEAMLIVYRRIVIQLEAERAAEAVEIRRKRMIAVLLLAAAS